MADGLWTSAPLPLLLSLCALHSFLFMLTPTHESPLRRNSAQRIAALCWWKSLIFSLSAQRHQAMIHTDVAASERCGPPSQRRTNAVISTGGKKRQGRGILSSPALPQCSSPYLSSSFPPDCFLLFYLFFKQLSRVSCAEFRWKGEEEMREAIGRCGLRREAWWRAPTSGRVKLFPRESRYHYLHICLHITPLIPPWTRTSGSASDKRQS